jgi:hypothetical protein
MELTQSHLRTSFQIFSIVFNCLLIELKHRVSLTLYKKKIYSERQKYGINSLKIKQNFFQKNLWTGQF